MGVAAGTCAVGFGVACFFTFGETYFKHIYQYLIALVK